MGDLFASGGSSAYPTSLDTFTSQADATPALTLDTTTAHSSKVNNLAQAVINLETYVGTRLTAGSIPFGTSTNLAQNNANLFWDNTNLRLGVGTASPIGELHVVTTNTINSERGITTAQHSTTAQGAIITFRKSRGTPASPTSVANGDYIARYNFEAYGTVWNALAFMDALITGIVTGDTIPTDIVFSAGSVSTNVPERMRITSTGNVGIGTTAPSELLHVNSTVAGRIRLDSTTARVILNNTTAVRRWDVVSDIDGTFSLADQTAGAIRFLINPTGSVGIGTTSPAIGNTEIRFANQTIASGLGQLSVVTSDSQAIDKGGSIILGGVYTGTSLADFANISGRKENGTDNNLSGYLAFSTRANGSLNSEKMRITSAGNVGIGTVSPGFLLTLGNTNNTRFLSATGATTGFALSYVANTIGGLISGVENSTGGGAITGTLANSSFVGSNTLTAFHLLSNSIVRMTIDSTGNVGIGTTAPATSALLDMTSTTGALLVSRMTTTQRDALTAVNGMIIYNSTTAAFNKFQGGVWAAF